MDVPSVPNGRFRGSAFYSFCLGIFTLRTRNVSFSRSLIFEDDEWREYPENGVIIAGIRIRPIAQSPLAGCYVYSAEYLFTAANATPRKGFKARNEGDSTEEDHANEWPVGADADVRRGRGDAVPRALMTSQTYPVTTSCEIASISRQPLKTSREIYTRPVIARQEHVCAHGNALLGYAAKSVIAKDIKITSPSPSIIDEDHIQETCTMSSRQCKNMFLSFRRHPAGRWLPTQYQERN